MTLEAIKKQANDMRPEDILQLAECNTPPFYKRAIKITFVIVIAVLLHVLVLYALDSISLTSHPTSQPTRTIEVSILHSDALVKTKEQRTTNIREAKANLGLSNLKQTIHKSIFPAENTSSPETNNNPTTIETTPDTDLSLTPPPTNTAPKNIGESLQTAPPIQHPAAHPADNPVKPISNTSATSQTTKNHDSTKSNEPTLMSKKGTLLDFEQQDISTTKAKAENEHIFSPELIAAIEQAKKDQREYLKGQQSDTEYVITEDGDGTRYVDIHGVCWKIPELGSDDDWVIALDGCNGQTKSFHFELNITTDILAPESPLNGLFTQE
ncbi:hypothetical protein GV054_14840 [Marinomonas mediterranea]|nr:hypothetical protein GV054_14840 [Marinomonas mediterranea]